LSGLTVVFVLLVSLNGLMFGVLRPQDKYETALGTVTTPAHNLSVYGGTGVVKYYVGHVKYEYKFGAFMFNGHDAGDKYLIRYRVDDPSKVRSYLFPFFMALIMFGEFILLVILYALMSSIFKQAVKSKPWAEPDWERAKKINRKFEIVGKIKFVVIAVIFVLSVCGVFASQPLYNSARNYKAGLYNYTFQSAQQLVCEEDAFTAHITKDNNSLFYSVMPRVSQKYSIEVAPKLGFECKVFDADYGSVFETRLTEINSFEVGLESGRVYYFEIHYDYTSQYQLAVILTVKAR
jgi:hypothetical protein